MSKIAMHCERLRIYVGERDKYRGKIVYKYIMEKAKEMDLAGCSVFRGVAGFAHDERMQTNILADVIADLPIVIEIIDNPEHIARIIPFVNEAVTQGLVTVDEVRVVRYGAHSFLEQHV